MKKILITGANSYIGTSFEKYMAQWPDKYQVDTLDMIDGSWREKSFAGYDCVFHVAGIAHSDNGKISTEKAKLYYAVNTDLTVETAKKAKAEGVKQFIFMSSAIVYGEKFVVIDGDGTVLRKTSVEPKVPVIKGLTISKLNVGEPIETEENVLLRQTLEMLSSMEQGDMFFKKVEISKVQIRAYVADSLICQGTPEHLMEAMEEQRLQMVIQELYEQDIYRGTIKVSGDDYISFTPKLDE